jgi:REP element-mobilizing transposase RayT
MPRAGRIWFPEATYHIIQRGNQQQPIFFDDGDRIWFLNTVKEAKEKMGFRIYLYVLMDNHFHLTIQTGKSHVSAIMQYINSTYAMRFNTKHKRSGHLFQGRFKGLLVDCDSYLLELSRYIHLNAVRAGIVSRPENYRWSSFFSYVEGSKSRHDWVDSGLILSLLAKNFPSQFQGYMSFINAALSREETVEHWLKSHINRQHFLGDGNFVHKALEKMTALPQKGSDPL